MSSREVVTMASTSVASMGTTTTTMSLEMGTPAMSIDLETATAPTAATSRSGARRGRVLPF